MNYAWVGAAVLLALLYLAPYGAVNQATYLLDPLHHAHPELFARDWFVSETPVYLPLFGWVGQALYVGGDGVIPVAVAHVVLMLVSYAAIAAMVRDWRAFLIVASLVTFTKGVSMGGNYLFVGYLQPSEVATAGWLVAMACFARDRYLACGIAAALAGLFHANFLVLGIGLFTLAGLLRRLSWRDHARVLVPQLIVLLPFLPSLLGAAGVGDKALWILASFHAPVHYEPGRLIRWIPVLVAWQLGAAAGLHLAGDSRPARALWWFSIASFAVCAGSAMLIELLPALTQARWSRVGPFGELACKAIVAIGLVQHATAPRTLTRRARILVAFGLLLPLYETGKHLQALAPWSAMGVAAMLVLLALWWRHALTLLAVLALAFAVYASPRAPGLTTATAAQPDELALAAWAHTTPVDTLFLAPPSEYRFRLTTERAMVVDAKSPPLQPVYLVQWYERLCAATAYPDAPTFAATEQRYDQLTAVQLIAIAKQFRADYIVTRVPTPFPTQPVYANDTYRVYLVNAQTGAR